MRQIVMSDVERRSVDGIGHCGIDGDRVASGKKAQIGYEGLPVPGHAVAIARHIDGSRQVKAW